MAKEKHLKTVTMKIDRRFVEMAANCIMGMIAEQDLGDVFLKIETNPDNDGHKFNQFEAATAVYQVLDLLFDGDREAIHDTGQLIVDCYEHKTVSMKEYES